MIRMSRAGRKRLLFGAIKKHCKRYPKGYLTTPKCAHAAGLKSSTNVRKMLEELEADGLIKSGIVEVGYQSGIYQKGWTLCRYEQILLPDHVIVINGRQYSMSGKEL